MSFTPISNDFIQYQAQASGTSAAGYFLKLYAAGTNTPISTALDSAGSVLVAKVELDSLGFAKNGSGGATTLYIDQSYRLVLYVNATDADANTFGNAVQDIDDIPQIATLSGGGEVVKNFATLALAVSNTGLVDGDSLNIAERTAGNGGGAMWDVVLSSTVTENTFNIVQGAGVGTLSLVLREDGTVNVLSLGAVFDGATDDTLAIQAALDNFRDVLMPSGSTVITGTGLIFKADQQKLSGAGKKTLINYTGTGTAIDSDGYLLTTFENFFLFSETGAIGVRIGPNSGETRFSHEWTMNNVTIFGDTPTFSSSGGDDANGFATGGITVEKAFYGNAVACEASWCKVGVKLFNQANGNTFTGLNIRAGVQGLVLDGGSPSNGNAFLGGNFESSVLNATTPTSLVFIGNSNSNEFVGVRMELTGAGTHVIVNPSVNESNYNEFIGCNLEGTVPAYQFGDGTGTDEVVSNSVIGGRSIGTWVINSDATNFVHPTGDIQAHAALVPGSGNLTDNGVRTSIDLTGNLAGTFGITGLTTTPTAGFLYERRGSQVFITVPTLNGTSNTTACTLTGIPTEIRPTSSKTVPIRIQNNGAITWGIGTIDSSGVITLSPEDGSGTFVSSGSKGVIACEINYMIK